MSQLNINAHGDDHEINAAIIVRLTSIYCSIAREKGIDIHMIVTFTSDGFNPIPDQRTW